MLTALEYKALLIAKDAAVLAQRMASFEKQVEDEGAEFPVLDTLIDEDPITGLFEINEKGRAAMDEYVEAQGPS